jgi:hypothetical protein
MGVGGFFRYIGSVLLLTATALLIVASVTAPTANGLSMFRVDMARNTDTHINFGSFGWCVRGGDDLTSNTGDRCSDSHVGYNIAEVVMDNVEGTRFSRASEGTTKALTNVMVLHAISSGLFFIAFLLSLGKGILVSLLATGITTLGFLLTAVAVICDFVLFSMVRRRVRRNRINGVSARYGPAAWCVLAAAVLSLIATVLVFITCCAGRREKKHRGEPKAERWHDGPAPVTTHRRRFWQRRSAY